MELQTLKSIDVASLKEFQPQYKHKMIPVTSLNIDRTYQRDEHTIAILMSREFNEEAFVAIVVAERDNGKLYIVDGQQRSLAAKYAGIQSVPALVFKSKGKKHEATIFDRINNGRKTLTPIQKFTAALVARYTYALDIKRIVEDRGFEIPKGGGHLHWGYFRCISYLQKVYLETGSIGLDKTLELILDVWDGQDDAMSSEILYGVHLFLERLKTVKLEFKVTRWMKMFGTKNQTATRVCQKAIQKQDKASRRGLSGYARYTGVADYLFDVYKKGK